MEQSRWRSVKHVLTSIDWPLLGALFGLLAMGLVLIYSATYRSHGSAFLFRQLTWIGAGLVGAVIVAAIPDYTLKRYAEVAFVLALGLAVAVHLAGSVAYGARRWISLFGVKVQPSEFLKVATILVLAKYTEHFKDRINSPPALGVLGLLSGLAFVVILKQPDLGTATATMAIVGGMVFVAGIDLLLAVSLFCLGAVPLLCPLLCLAFGAEIGWSSSVPLALAVMLVFLIVALVAKFARLPVALGAPLIVSMALSAGILASPMVFNALNPYQRVRLTSFLVPESDPRGSGYNLIQSMIAVGSGGLWGKGLFKGSQNVLGFLPHKHTDFIFSVLAEECGFWGVALMLGLILLFLARCLMLAASAKDGFGTFVAVGVTSMFAFHFLVNIGMTLGLMPITGVPLLLVSYGGSALTSSLVCVGLLMNIALRRERFVF